MPLSVGAAASTYDLDLRPFRKSLKEARGGISELKAAGQDLRVPIDLDFSAFHKSIQEAKAEIEELRKASQGLGQGGGGAGLPSAPALPSAPSAPRAPATPQNGDRQVLALANARAREAVAAGEAARAEQILKTALEQVDRTSIQAINTSTRLLNIQNRLSNEKGPVVLPRTIAGFSGEAEKAVGNAVQLGQAFVALQGVQVAADLSQTGAQASLVRGEFDKLAKQSGTTGDAMLAALQKASKGEISDLNLELAANRANMLGVAKSSKEMATLLEIARDRAKKLGIDSGQAFNDLVTGLGRASAEILDNLAIQVNAEEVNKKYAASVGKTVEQLTQAEKRQAIVNAVIEQGQASLIGSADAADEAAGSWARFNVSLDNAKASAGVFVNTSTPLIPILGAISNELDVLSGRKPLSAFLNMDTAKLVTSLSPVGQIAGVADKAMSELQRAVLGVVGVKLPETFSAWDTSVSNVGRAFNILSNTSSSAMASVLRLAGVKIPEGLNLWSVASLVAGGALRGLSPAAQQATQATQQLAISNAYYVPTAQQAAAATLAKAQAEVQAATSGQLYTNAQGQATLATQQSADASLLATTAQAQYQTQMQLMEMQTKAAADQFLALNPNIDQSGVASALAAGKISTAVAQYIAMTLHTAEARAQLAALQAQAGVAPGPVGVSLGGSKPKAGPGRRGDVGAEFDAPLGSSRAVNQANANIALSKAQAEAEKARQQALEDQITTTGTAAQKQKLYNDRLTEAKRIYGENSAEAIRAETALKSFQQSQAKGGGGGRAKVSDQEKLNNGLYQDAVKFGYKMQDEEQKHVDNLQQIDQKHLKANAKIWQDYYQKLSQAEHQYRQASLDSRADFYGSLASIDNKALQQSASQRYEEIARKTAQIAQTEGADKAQAYQEAATSGLNKELQIEKQIADLRDKKGKNKSQQKADEERAKYLDGVLKAQREADANRVADAQAAGSQVASERDKALADEQASYQEQVDQEAKRFGKAQQDIATDSERSAERQITAAHLAKKNIQDVRGEVQGLGDDYAKVLPGGTPTLGPVASQPGVTSATPAQEPQSAPTPTADTAARGAAGQALNIMQVADVAVLGAINAQTAALGAKLDMLAERVRGVESAIRTIGGRDALS